MHTQRDMHEITQYSLHRAASMVRAMMCDELLLIFGTGLKNNPYLPNDESINILLN